MILESFSDANKQLIEYKPLFNKVVKTANLNFDKDQSHLSKKFINNKSILLICDYEGKIVFIDETFGKHTHLSDLQGKSILDFLHQEDLPIVIEQLVILLQEKSQCLTIKTRFINSENQNFYSKWQVGYLRGLFYFYPIELPKFLENKSEYKNETFSDNMSKKSTLPNQLLWKIEVLKTLCEWDSLILKQIKYCTSI